MRLNFLMSMLICNIVLLLLIVKELLAMQLVIKLEEHNTTAGL